MAAEDDSRSVEDALLLDHLPYLKYDSGEAFFADAADEWTLNPSNVLRRASAEPKEDGDPRPPEVLASATPGPGENRLSLDLLGPTSYGGKAAYVEGDCIGDLQADYRDQYRDLRSKNAPLRNWIYGRVARSGEGGDPWLQYWFFYFYNDYRMAGGIGLHEGDWEMVQLHLPAGPLHPDSEPVEAVYAQHKHAQTESWPEVEKVEDKRPVVYVARGSHASYFEAGIHETEVWADVADGIRVPKQLSLSFIREPTPGWLAWPGRWGDTRPRRLWRKVDQPSPTGPCAHPQWDDPDHLLKGSIQVEPKVRKAEEIHRLDAQRSTDGRLQVDFDFAGKPRDHPERLLVNVNSKDEHELAPRAFTFVVDSALKGTIETRISLNPGHSYEINLSTIDQDEVPSGSTFRALGPAPPPDPKEQRLLRTVGTAIFRGLAPILNAFRRRPPGPGP